MMRNLTVSLACLLLVLGLCVGQDVANDSISPYLIVIDGGSTGSRLHVFQFTRDDNDDESAYQCERRGSSRANVPLSAFAPSADEMLDPSVVAAHMVPLFEFAAGVIPKEYHNSTVAKYEATAGMRLLTEEQQEAIYDALYEGLMQSESFVFRGLQRGDIETLSGSLEGYYGAVAANFLSGIIDSRLQVIGSEGDDVDDDDLTNRHPIGAIDMGGASSQIVWMVEQIDNGNHNCDNSAEQNDDTDANEEYQYTEEEFPQTCASDLVNQPILQGDKFFSHSYLAYGVDQFRERLWNTLISDRIQQDHSDSCDTKIIYYPCGFEGHQITYNDYTLIGTGDADECTKQVQRLIPHPEQAIDNHQERSGRVVGGIEHPTVRGRFFAMSLYFFTLDSLRVLSSHDALDSAWPQPSINELTDALEGLCSRSWTDDLVEIQHNAHEFTRAEVLPHRCFESVYMVTLLRDGFGFHPDSRDITFTFLVDGSEVEWSLGMALEMYSTIRRQAPKPEETNATCHGKEKSQNRTLSSEQQRIIKDASIPEPDSAASFMALAQGSD